MAIGDYILCCKCEVKLIYDGDRDQREWWEERFGKEPEIECPNCKPQRTWVGLTEDERDHLAGLHLYAVRGQVEAWIEGVDDFARAIEAKLKEKNT